MKKVLFWVFITSAVVALISGGIVGINIFNHDYDRIAVNYIFVFSTIVMFASGVPYKLLKAKCPHCGKIRWLNETFCPYCGKEIK